MLARQKAKVMILNIDSGGVDQVLQRVGTGVVILEFSIVRDSSCGGVIRSDYTTDVNSLNVGEVWENSRSCRAGCLRTLLEREV